MSLVLDLVSGLQVTFNKSNILAPSVLNTTFFNQGGQFNTSALLQVGPKDEPCRGMLSTNPPPTLLLLLHTVRMRKLSRAA